jgi:catechol 2,3-dioxygenase-like lactoylglutathione lyase family enzyme
VEAIMFATTKAFSGFSVDDLAAARQFYRATLGIRVSEDNGLHDGPPIAWFTDPASNVCPVLQLAQRALAEVPWMDRRGRFVAGEHAGGRRSQRLRRRRGRCPAADLAGETPR